MDGGNLPAVESGLHTAVRAIAISPEDARALAGRYRTAAEASHPKADSRKIQQIVSKKIISRYARLAGTSGGLTSLTGIIPGIGTALAMLGGGAADVAICMKLQVDMTMCIAAAYDWDLNNEDAKHLCFIIAAGSSLEKAGEIGAVKIASKAGVKMVKQYVQGAALQTIKQMFARVGISFTQKALMKAVPFGIGVAIGSAFNFALTKYVGNTADNWFRIENETKEEAAVA